MTADLFDILVTPIERTIVTTADSPSGIAATARLTATMKVSSMDSKPKSPLFITLNANMNTHIPSTAHVSTLESCESFI